MFDFDVVTGPSDLAKLERSEARRPPKPPAKEAPTGNPSLPQPTSPGLVSGIVGDQAAGYSGAGPA
jgi:hypothetical protein